MARLGTLATFLTVLMTQFSPACAGPCRLPLAACHSTSARSPYAPPRRCG